MSHVLIAGCGFVGEALARRRTSEGHETWGLRRRTEGLPTGVHPLTADLCDPDSLRNLPPDLDFIFYTASAGASSAEAYRAAYVTGMENLLRALADQKLFPRRVFFTSSTSVYGQEAGEWVDEDSPAAPEHHTGQIMLEAEQSLFSSSYPATAVRLGGVYGPGRRRLIESVQRGEATCAEGPPRYVNRIHRDDCAGALHHLMSLEDAEQIYLAVDDEPAEEGEVMRWLAGRLGAPPPRMVPPAEGESPRRRSNKRCKNARLTASGYRLLYPSFREGYEAILREERG
jgi:nucleoside-diphosphate-sugar epimerase